MEVVKVVFCRGYTAAVLATEPAAEHEDSLGFAAFRCVLLCTPRIWKGHGMTLHKSLWRTLMENASGVDGFCLLTVVESRWLSCFACESPYNSWKVDRRCNRTTLKEFLTEMRLCLQA